MNDSVTEMIPISQIKKVKNIRNDDIDIEDLKISIKEHGLLQPVIVSKAKDDSYRLIAGHRRYRACVSLGWNEIEAKVQDFQNDMTVQLTENLQRKDMSIVEESECIHNLNQELKVNPGRLAKIVGKDSTWVNKRLRYYELRKHLLSSGIIPIPFINKMTFDIALIVGKYEQKYWIQMCAYLLGKRWYPERIEDYCKSVVDPSYKPLLKNPSSKVIGYNLGKWKDEDGFSFKKNKFELTIQIFCTSNNSLKNMLIALQKAGGEPL